MPRLLRLTLALLFLLAAFPAAPVSAQDPLPPQVYLPLVGLSDPPRWGGPEGGSPVSMAVDPRSDSTLYIGSWGAGVFKSVNGGESWSWSGTGLGNLFIDSLAIDPVTPDVLFAGTHGAGVYKSTDAGATWVAANQGINNPAVVYSLAVSKANHNLVFAGTRFDPNNGSPPWGGVLYRSTDGGASWQAVLTNLGGASAQDWIYSIAPHPLDPNLVLLAAHEHGPYRSTSAGAAGTWQAAAGGVGDLGGRSVLFDPRPGSNLAYYAAWHKSGAFRSTNLGQSWSQDRALNVKVYPNAFALAPSNPDVLYLGSMRDAADTTTLTGVLRSFDAGRSWQHMWYNRDVYSLAVSPGSANRVFAGVRFLGLQRSDDYGASWAARNTGFTSLQVTGTVSAGGSTVFASTLAAGVFRSDDGGMNWAAYNAGLPDLNVYGLQIDPARPYRLYALTEKAGLQMIDISAGSGWVQAAAPSAGLSAASSSSAPFPPGDPLRLPDPLPDSDASQPDVQAEAFTMPLLSMTYAPSNPALAYIGTSGAGVYRSTNGGAPGTWQASGLSGKTVRSLAVPPGNSAVVYAATTEVGAVQVSSNSGANWSPSALPGLAVYALATSPHEPDAVYAGSSDGLWKKSGASWSRLGLAGRTVTAVAAHPARPGVLLAGTTGGAYYSGDNGVNWVPLSSELAPFTVSAFTFLPTDEAHVLVGTTTRSTVRVRLP